MTQQRTSPLNLTLFAEPEIPQTRRLPIAARCRNLDDRFAAWISANPEVYTAAREIALDLVERGHKRAGIKAIAERMRWLHMVQTQGGEYLIDNSMLSRLARLLMERNPQLAGFFEIRELANDRRNP